MADRKILIVDDEARIRELLHLRLSSQGYQVIEAANGEEGIEQAIEHTPDLILMDVMMPKMDGAEAARILQENPLTKNIPVIFLTAMITKEEETGQVSGSQANTGKHRFISKPFDTQNLLMEIQKAIVN